MASWGNVKWGDVDETADVKVPESTAEVEATDNEEKGAGGASITSRFVTGPDKKGIKTITEFGTNEEGKKIKVIRRVKVSSTLKKVNKNVLMRRKWAKFGNCSASEKNVTYASIENIHLVLKPKTREEEQGDDDPMKKLKTNDSIVICRNCGKTGHWTLKCPERDRIMAKGMTEAAPGPAAAAAAGGGGGSGKYVPMHMRQGAKASSMTMQRDDSSTIRVTNISEDTTEDDLRDLFRRFGHTSRVYLARDRQTQVSRGFAFISYTTREAAQSAIDALNGHGYDNLILHVEFAKPREDKPVESKGSWSMRGTK